jgi:hypothetical protein
MPGVHYRHLAVGDTAAVYHLFLSLGRMAHQFQPGDGYPDHPARPAGHS